MAVVWKLLLDPGSGYLNVLLRDIGVVAPSWLRDPTWAMPAVPPTGFRATLVNGRVAAENGVRVGRFGRVLRHRWGRTS